MFFSLNREPSTATKAIGAILSHKSRDEIFAFFQTAYFSKRVQNIEVDISEFII